MASYIEQIGQRLAGWSMASVDAAAETTTVAGMEVPTHFRGTFSYGQNERLVHLTCRVEGEKVAADTIELQGFDVDELEQLGVPMMRDFLTLAAAGLVVGDGATWERRKAGAQELRRTRRRNAMSDERIARAAEVYEREGIEAVMVELGRPDAPLSERHAWRYVEAAQRAGLIEPRRQRKEDPS